jgi:2-iminobutanoate/2-iminopropanoate deaminase
MKKEIISKDAPQAIGPYSQGIEIDNLVFLSGQIGIMENGEIASGGTLGQFKQIMKNIEYILKELNLGFSSIIKTTLFLKNMDDFQEINSAYKNYWTKPYPARSTVEVARLPKNVDIEIEVIAIKR